MHQGEVDIDDQLWRGKAGKAVGGWSGKEVSANLRLSVGPGCTPDHIPDFPGKLQEAGGGGVLWSRHLEGVVQTDHFRFAALVLRPRCQSVAISWSIEMMDVSSVGEKDIGKDKVCLLDIQSVGEYTGRQWEGSRVPLRCLSHVDSRCCRLRIGF